MKVLSLKKRELIDLSLVVIIAIVFTLFSLSIDFIDRIHKYFSAYTTLAISEFLIKVVFLWLVMTLWITYQRWREAIRKQKELEDIISSINADVLVVVDRDRNIVMCNESVKRVFDYEVDEVINQKTDLLYSDRTSEPLHRREIHDKLERDGFHIGLATGKKKNGDIIPLEIIAGNLRGRSGAVLLLRDITERKEMEHKLLQSEKLKSLGELAHGVAHDFNNALAAILGRAQLLRMNVEPPPDKEERRESLDAMKKGLEVIERAAKDGAETVRRIQEFSRRIDDDKYFITTIDLNEIIDNALEFTRVRWKENAESKGIKINIKKEFSTLPTTSGSTSELREVFTNLINNAVDAMPQGGEIRIKTYKENSQIVVIIEDTGIGIADDRKDRIFDPFFTTKGVKSSGLGMSVSYGIINRHHGTITVDSTEGQGTTFTIRFPLSEKMVEEEKTEPMPEEQRKAKILVIDDEEDICELLKDISTDKGHKVETAPNGSQGIEIFKENKFDFVFTDLGMPGMSGWQVAEEIKKINRKVPVALITGWGVQLKDYELREKGVDFVVSKPFQVDQVLKLVQKCMILIDRFKAA